jgi:aminobenzoyl-glutamate utilization protein B
MKTFLLFLTLILTFHLNAQKQRSKEVIDQLDRNTDHYWDIAYQIWNLAELGYQEHKSTALLQQELTRAGFEVETGVAGMPTAFVATSGQGRPVIGILAEFDALPGVSQQAVPEPMPRDDLASGHACGHHLFGTASTAAAAAVKSWLESKNHQGTIKVFGTPAEEGGSGKVYMVRAGLFDDVDAVLHWHPANKNEANAASSLANKSAKFRFYGSPAHAAGAPEKGRSALDGVEAMNYMTNLLREHIPMESRIHYVITHGGEAPNVVPAFSEVFYYVRHPEMKQVVSLFERVVEAARGAAMGTGTTVEFEVIHGNFNVLPNEPIARMMHKNLEIVGGVTYDQVEQDFAEKIITSYDGSRDSLKLSEIVAPFEVILRGKGGSTDVGDVSWTVPTAGLRTATWVPGTFGHSWQAVAAGGMSIGKKGMMVAAKTLALTAIDLYQDPDIIEKATQELNRRRGPDYKYESLLGDREPPLDYRK